MRPAVRLAPLDAAGLVWAQAQVSLYHYLHTPVDARCSLEGYAVQLGGVRVGCLLVGRPEATRCYPWYGSVADVRAGRASCTRWQVLNLARVWLSPVVQPGGAWYSPMQLPGYRDRAGWFVSTLASTAVRLLVARVGADYLIRRPPCFLDEPYRLEWLLSYCDPRIHRGTLYRTAGFTLARTNAQGLQTWRVALPALTADQDAAIRKAARQHPRSIAYRAARAAADNHQLAIGL